MIGDNVMFKTLLADVAISPVEKITRGISTPSVVCIAVAVLLMVIAVVLVKKAKNKK